MPKERCKCGNLVPLGELKEGRCVPCVREAGEKIAKAKELDHIDELRASLSFWSRP